MATTSEFGSTTNSYELLAKLAMGGMAEIFLARANAAGVERYVVLKRVLRDRTQDQNFVEMFLDEARLAAQLQHANIAQVHDIGRLGDSYFFTMEYVHGETVADVFKQSKQVGRAIPIGCVLTIVAGAAAGLHYAHERIGVDGRPLGIVHRDVSPSNMMITYEGTVKLVDFGVAKATHRTSQTRQGTVKGKLGYMSPEQCNGHPLDSRSDLFSLGIVAWEMLTGERLFKRGTEYETMDAIVNKPIARPSSLRADIPPELDAIVVKLLEKSADRRYQTADELLEAIEAVAVRTSSVLSTAGLGRFVRELTGRRPEPWIAIRQVDKPEVVTVTAGPLRSGIAAVPADATSGNLARLPDLSANDHGTPAQVVAVPMNDPIGPTRSWSYGELAAIAPAPRPSRRRWVFAGAALLALAILVAFAALPGATSARTVDPPVVAAIKPDAAVPSAPIDAAIAVAKPAVDAGSAVVDAGVVASVVPVAPVAQVRQADPAKHHDILASCASAAFVARNAGACVLAACKAADTIHARRYFMAVSAGKQKTALTRSCASLGVVLDTPLMPPADPPTPVEPKPTVPKPDCKADPLACQF